MNQREISELRRRFKPEKCAINHIYGCFVNGGSREIISDLDEPLSSMPQEEAEKYLALLKKALSGKLGKNLIDIVFSTQQVADSDEHRLLTTLRDSRLKDGGVRREFYEKVIADLDLDESNYLLLLAHDTYDVPYRGKDGKDQTDAGDQVFSYIICCICPVKQGKESLGFFPGENEFHSYAAQTVAPPELGFLFPAFDDRAANLYNALFYSRKADQLHQEFIATVFHTEPPMSPAEQKEAFQSALSEALGNAYNVEVVQALHERLREKIEANKESREEEPLEVTSKEIGAVLTEQGVAPDQVEEFKRQCEEHFGQGVLNPANLMDTGRFEVKTADASVTVDPEHSYVLELREIDGRNYLLLPVDDGVEINGFPIGTKVSPTEN